MRFFAWTNGRLPQDYCALLTPRETQKALFALKNFIEAQLCYALRLMRVTVPLIVDVESGVNDYLDRDGSRTPVQFHIPNDDLPLSIGDGIGQSRTFMLLLKKAHLGEVSVSVWPKVLKDLCAKKNIHMLE